MNYNINRINANRERIRNLPTITLAGGQVIPAPSVLGPDRDDWYGLKDMEANAAKTAVDRQVKALKPERSSVQIKLDYINGQILDAKLAKMPLRDQMLYLEKVKLEKQMKADGLHEKAAANPMVKKAEATIDKLLAQYEGEQSVGLAALKEAIQDRPEDIDYILPHLRSVVATLHDEKTKAFNEANNKLSSAQLQAQAEHSREQAEYARHNVSIMEANHELDQLDGSAGVE